MGYEQREGNVVSAFNACIVTRAHLLILVNHYRRMFEGATSFNQDITSWDLSNVFNMSYVCCINITEASKSNTTANSPQANVQKRNIVQPGHSTESELGTATRYRGSFTTRFGFAVRTFKRPNCHAFATSHHAFSFHFAGKCLKAQAVTITL